jgi:SNF2 family DNA or RNA helicase
MKAELRIKDNRLFVRTPYSPALVDRFRLVPGREFHGDTKEWSFPAVKDVLLMLCDCLGVLPWMLDQDIRNLAEVDGRQAFNRVALDESVVNGHVFLTEPYAHQRTNLARLVQNKRWLLADECGTGKTWAVVSLLANHPSVGDGTLVVCPKSVIAVWQDELRKHGGLSSRVVSEKQTRVLPLSGDPKITIANYERVLAQQDDFKDGEWDIIVLDEVHKCKSWTAQTSRLMRKLSAKANRVYGLSGTPSPQGLEDWFGVLGAVDPNLIPAPTLAVFYARYCVRSRLPNGIWVTTGYRNVHELHDYVSRITSRVTKAECLSLPPKIFVERHCELEGEQARVYRELRRDAVARLTKQSDEGVLTANNILTEQLRLLQVCGGGVVPSDDGVKHTIRPCAKLGLLEEVLDEIGPKPVIIWAVFRDEVEAILKHLSDHGESAYAMHGDIGAEERREAVEGFQRGDRRFFVGTASAGGVGLTLTASDTTIFFSRNFNAVDWLQAQDRLYRIGQDRKVTIFSLVAKNTVDEKIVLALEKKLNMQELLLHNKIDEVI